MGLEAGPKGSTVTKRSARRISVTLTEAEHAARRAETEAQLLTRAQPRMSASALELPDMVLSFMASPNLQPVSTATLTCNAGCSACCHQHTAALIPEVILLSWALAASPAPARAVVSAQILERAKAIQGTTGYRRQALRVACGLLTDTGHCAAHGNRPGTCRAENSIDDPARCLPKRRPARPRPTAGVGHLGWTPACVSQDPAGTHMVDGEVYNHFNAAVKAVQAVLKARGLEHHLVELTLGLALVLTDESVIPRWAQGDPAAFAAVRYPYPQPEAQLTETHELTFRAGRRLPVLQGDCP